MQDITDNKKFWKTNRPYFSDRGYYIIADYYRL